MSATCASPFAEGMTAALDYWRDKLWQSAKSVGVDLTDEQLEAMAGDLVVASKEAPANDE